MHICKDIARKKAVKPKCYFKIEKYKLPCYFSKCWKTQTFLWKLHIEALNMMLVRYRLKAYLRIIYKIEKLANIQGVSKYCIQLVLTIYHTGVPSR